VVGIDSQGSAGGSESPFCNSSIEILSGERKKRHAAVARRHIYRDSGVDRLLAQGVDIVDLERQVAEISPALVYLAVPVIGQLDQRRAFGPDLSTSPSKSR
jgi:hypothetical protein